MLWKLDDSLSLKAYSLNGMRFDQVFCLLTFSLLPPEPEGKPVLMGRTQVFG